LLVAIITFLYFLKLGLVKEKRGSLLMVALTVLILIWGYSQNRDWTSLLEQELYPDPIIHSETSKYQHLVVTKSRLDEYRLYINGNTQYSSFDETRYHELLIHPAVELSKPENVLLLGAGDGLALREVLKYKSIKNVTLVDLDPAMVKLHSSLPDLVKLNDNAFADSRVKELDPVGLTNQGIRNVYMNTGDVDKNNRKIVKTISSVSVFNLDADKFIGAVSDQKWNMVVIDFPDPSSVELAKLYSKQFYQKLGKLVTAGGMVSIQATSPYYAKEAYLNIQRTMESAGFKTIPYHLNIPSFGDWGWFLAWNDDRSVDFVKGQIAQMREFSVETNFLTPDVFRASLVFGKGELESKDTSINTLMSPILLSIYDDESWTRE
jgi:spermidine synthase